jgi:DNA-binding NarL/FixJ family response regulator
MKLRVFLVDDHDVVRAGLRALLSAEPDLEVVGESGDGGAALRSHELRSADVLVLDLSLPRIDGTEVLRRVHRVQPELPVVVLSMYPEEPFASRAIAAGAAAYVHKSAPSSALIEAIRTAARGTPQPVRAPAPAALPHEKLTPREFQVFVLLIRGRSVSEIAAELDLTMPTVSTHLGRVREKLGARTNGDVVAYAHRAGLIDPAASDT